MLTYNKVAKLKMPCNNRIDVIGSTENIVVQNCLTEKVVIIA